MKFYFHFLGLWTYLTFSRFFRRMLHDPKCKDFMLCWVNSSFDTCESNITACSQKSVFHTQTHSIGNILNSGSDECFITEFYLFYDKAPAQWLALNAMELVTSRLSAEEVNRELSVSRARRVWWHVWRWGWGARKLIFYRTMLGVSQSVPRGSPSTRSFRSLGRQTAVEVWLHRAGALRNPISAQRLACWYAQRREVHRLSRGQGRSWD